MITHLLTRIDLMMNSFSKGQKRIALYIEEHYDKAAFMTASKLGETVGVSESTVVRFASELGYDGYPKLQKAMQEMIRNKLTSVQRIEVTSSRIGDQNVLDSVLNQDIEKIRRTIEETSHEDFNRAVDEICEAKRIYIFGVRSTGAIAGFLSYYFGLIFDNVTLINTTSAASTYEQIFRISEEDVMIGISFPRYSSMAVEAMDFAGRSDGLRAFTRRPCRRDHRQHGFTLSTVRRLHPDRAQRHGVYRRFPCRAAEPDQRPDRGDRT